MAKKPKIVLNSAGMRELLKSAEIRAAVRAEAQPILAEAIRRAPEDSGDYKRSLKIVDDTTDRAVARVTATDPKAMLVESRLGVLGRAVRGKSMAVSREKARIRRAERAHDRRVAREEDW